MKSSSSENKSMADKLKKRMEEQRIILDSVPAMVFYKDKENRFVRTNKIFEEAMGMPKEKLEGKSCFDIYPKEQADAFWDDDKEVMASGKPKRNIIEPMNTVKGMVWLQTDKIPFRDTQGEVAGIIGFAIDITERREMEKALVESEANYRSIFESANDAIFIRDVKTYRIVDANSKACEMLCCSKEEILGQGIEDITAEVTTFKKFKQFFDNAANGEPQLFEWLIKDKIGREFWIEANLRRALIGGQYRLLSVTRDITERKQLMEMKDGFINTISHELRTPLAAIRESISIVLDGLTGKLEKDNKECLDIAKRNVDRLSRLIDNILDFQKLEAGKMPFNIEENDMNDVVEETQRSMLSLVGKKGLSLTVKKDGKLPRIRFDRDKIIQVLTNLMNNAIKFTKEGKITIATKAQDNQVIVSVKDTGIGIKKEDLPKLFKKFEQIGRVSSAELGGTGLGLAISKELIERQKGKIWAESELGKGTTISFTLPIKERRG